jgi:glyoxylase-like metal-dependent hydrolase (beta-lactamase superfamily II)
MEATMETTMRLRAPELSRRGLLSGLAAASASGLAYPALATGPMANTQVPAAYRFKLGGFECTVVSDGPLRLGTFSAEMFKGLSQEQIDEVLAANFLDKNNFVVEQNALVVNTGGKLVLIDTGIGHRKIYGPRSGRLLANLRAAGIDPASIDVVALSHGHPDHVWGLVGEDGKPNYPNAQIYITQADLDYWTDAAKLSHPSFGHAIGPIRDTLLPLRDRIIFLKDGQDVVPGLQALSTPGHTVGHTSFVISSQGSSIVNIADLGHQPALQMENPRAEFARDTDSKQGVTTRLRVFDMVANQKIPILAYHFPWPGIGHVAKRGEGYRYVAADMQTVL